jgi:hypothetical protein
LVGASLQSSFQLGQLGGAFLKANLFNVVLPNCVNQVGNVGELGDVGNPFFIAKLLHSRRSFLVNLPLKATT